MAARRDGASAQRQVGVRARRRVRAGDPPCGAPKGASRLQPLLAELDNVSVELIHRGMRETLRGESMVGSYSLQLGSRRVQARAGAQARWQGDRKTAVQDELTSFYTCFERRKELLSTHQRSLQFGTTLRWFDRSGLSRRLFRMDGATSALWTRLIGEFSDLSRFRQAVDAERARWIEHGISYTKRLKTLYPEDLAARQRQTEADYEQFFELSAWGHDGNKQYLMVNCLQPATATRVDVLLARLDQAPRGGGGAERDHERDLEAVLADPSSWQARWLVVNEKSTRTSQPGWTVGVVAAKSRGVEGQRNFALFPRA